MLDVSNIKCCTVLSFLCGWTHIACATVPSKEQCDPTLHNPTHPTNPVFQTRLDSSSTYLPCLHLHNKGNCTVNDSCLLLFQSYRYPLQICTFCHLQMFVLLVTAIATVINVRYVYRYTLTCMCNRNNNSSSRIHLPVHGFVCRYNSFICSKEGS